MAVRAMGPPIRVRIIHFEITDLYGIRNAMYLNFTTNDLSAYCGERIAVWITGDRSGDIGLSWSGTRLELWHLKSVGNSSPVETCRILCAS
jgi:hypothetical protein